MTASAANDECPPNLGKYMTPLIKQTLKLLEKTQVIPKSGLFDINESMLTSYIEMYGSLTKNIGTGLIKKREIGFARRLAGLNLLKHKFARGGNASTCNEGLVYVIANNAWPEHLKIGMTTDLVKRLASYQVYDPFKKFYVKNYEFSFNRRHTEETILRIFNVHLESGEWIKFSESDKIIQCVRTGYYTLG